MMADNVQKGMMHMQSCCIANLNLIAFLPFLLPSPSSLLKLHIVVIQKFCYRGNETSHFSSLFAFETESFKKQPCTGK